jgi:hypothetical protein
MSRQRQVNADLVRPPRGDLNIDETGVGLMAPLDDPHQRT